MERLLYACLMMLTFGISLHMSLRLLYGARGPQVGDPVYQVIHVASWSLTIIPLGGFILVGTNWLSWFVLAITMIAGLELILARRSMQRRAAWELLTGTLEAQQPAVQVLQNHEARFTGLVGRAFRKLVDALQQGTPLRQAISENRRALPEQAQAYAALDALAGTTMSAATSEARFTGNRATDETLTLAAQQLFQRYTYLVTLIVVMAGIMTFLLVNIIPSYYAIFEDFEMELPAMTVWLVAFGSPFSTVSVGIVCLALLVVLLVAGLVVGLLYLCDMNALRPITDRLFFSRHRAEILRMLALAAERGQSFQLVLQRLTDGKPRYSSPLAVERMKRAYQQITAGMDWKQALQSAAILRDSDLPTLETAQHAGNLSWVLRMLADQKTRSMIFRWTAIEQIIFPLQVALLGVFVLFICVAFFLPLVELIHGLV